jgi:Holliday junction resolvase RusA-like endonuclease
VSGGPIRLVILGRPATKKNSMRLVQTGSRTVPIPSKVNVAWTNDAIRQLREQYAGPRGALPPLRGPVSVSYRFILRSTQWEGDADNYMAATNDALQKAGVIADDKQIRCGTFSKQYDQANARVEVDIHALEEAAA